VRRPPRQTVVLFVAASILLLPACRASSYPQLLCDDDSRQNILHLVAQAVPSATLIPCIERLHPGWTYGGSEVRSGFVHFWLDSDRVGDDAVDLTMTKACSVAGDTPLPVAADDAGLRLYEEEIVQHPGVTVRHYVFTGGCATVRYSFTRQTAPSIFDQAEDLIGYNLRSDHVRAIRTEAGLTLCGAEAPPCPG
jgi:hypothetical protein